MKYVVRKIEGTEPRYGIFRDYQVTRLREPLPASKLQTLEEYFRHPIALKITMFGGPYDVKDLAMTICKAFNKEPPDLSPEKPVKQGQHLAKAS